MKRNDSFSLIRQQVVASRLQVFHSFVPNHGFHEVLGSRADARNIGEEIRSQNLQANGWSQMDSVVRLHE